MKSHFGSQLDWYGNGVNEIQRKHEGILDYKYHIVLENESRNNLISEKIFDSMLGLSVPIYYGAPNISEYFNAQKEFQFSPTRPRKLLLHKKEIRKLQGSVQKQGLTLIVLKIFFNNKGIAKIDLGLGRGKKDRDKRADEKSRDWQRQKQRLLKVKN